MLTSLGGGLLGLLDRRLVLTAWLPTLLFWGGLGLLAVTGSGWPSAVHWWLRQPAQFQVAMIALALAWITFWAYMVAALVPVFIRIGEGYLPGRLSWLIGWRLKAHEKHQNHMQNASVYSWQYADYPLGSVLPTRLGNILKASEEYPLTRYGIDAVIVWPRLFTVLPDQFVSSIAAAKAPLDLMAVIGALASAFAVAGAAIAGALLPWYAPLACFAGSLLVAWLAYAGAVQAARPYAQLIRAAFDVHRGLLLDAAGLARPKSLQAERRQWEQITHLWYQGTPEDAALLGYPDA
jgi:hypothetical protein